jgi:hypothetical protein
MLFLTLFLIVLFVPGYLVAALIGTREYRFLIALPLSLFCFIVFSSLSSELDLGTKEFTIMYGAITVMLSGLLFLRARRGNVSNRNFSTLMFSETLAMGTVLFIIVATAAYHLAYGYYDEVPSDLYQHLDYTRLALREGRYWYHLISWVAQISGSSKIELYPYVLVSNAIIFVIAAAVCADRLFRALHFSPAQHQVAVLLAVFFVFAQMGIHVISFVRYYSYAPTMINFSVYFTGLVCALNLLENKDNSMRSVMLIAITVFTSYFIHNQETLFIVLACALLVVWSCLERIVGRRKLGIRKLLWPLVILLLVIAGGCSVNPIYSTLALATSLSRSLQAGVLRYIWCRCFT